MSTWPCRLADWPAPAAHLAALDERDRAVLCAVARAYLLDEVVLVSHRRTPEVVEARWAAMALLARAGHQPSAIARIVRKNEATVRYGLRQRHRVHRPTLRRLADEVAQGEEQVRRA